MDKHSYGTTTAYVDDLLRRLDVVTYIRQFNQVGGAKISSFSDLMVALDLKECLGRAYDVAREAAPGTIEEFDEAVREKLEPAIVSTFLIAVPEECRIWAADIAADGPKAYDAPSPFVDTDRWVQWVMDNEDGPRTICGPTGENVLEAETQDLLLRRALKAELATAMRNGWLQWPTVVHFADRIDPAAGRVEP